MLLKRFTKRAKLVEAKLGNALGSLQDFDIASQRLTDVNRGVGIQPGPDLSRGRSDLFNFE
jgi:hypothetical protein